MSPLLLLLLLDPCASLVVPLGARHVAPRSASRSPHTSLSLAPPQTLLKDLELSIVVEGKARTLTAVQGQTAEEAAAEFLEAQVCVKTRR